MTIIEDPEDEAWAELEARQQQQQLASLRPEDVLIETFAKHAGRLIVGMSSGIKLTHRPTGISVTCDNERSQHRNRDKAWYELQKLVAAHKPQDDWVCPFCYTKGCPTPKECRELAQRNHVIEEIAQHIEKFQAFGPDTINSFAIYIRGLKR